jgi:hypothetical protein
LPGPWIAAFVFSVITFDPFRVGWKGYLYCLGIAIVTPFLLEQVLEKWNAARIFKGLAVTACAAALTSLVLLAVIRGDLFAEQMKDTAPVIIFDDAQPQPQPQTNFYDATVQLLRLAMALLAVAMELGAGLALHEAWRMGSDSSEDWERLGTRLGDVRQRMLTITYEITTLRNEAPVFAARFWRNFYRAMLIHTIRGATTKLLVLALGVFVLAQGRVLAQVQTTLVVAVDLTQSVAVSGPDHKTEFQKNIDAVTKLLAQVPANSRVTVIGITDQSFAQPDILLSGTIPADAGYFGERLSLARSELVQVWKSRIPQLKPKYHYTDIIGAMMLASQIFHESGRHENRALVVFSDMRHRTRGLNTESPIQVPSFSEVGKSRRVPVADLHHSHVYVLGVDNGEKQITYWLSLRQFWTEYFLETGAILEEYSAMRDATIIFDP